MKIFATLRIYFHFLHRGIKMKKAMIKRPIYLEKLILRMNNGLVKIITGVRRCGKSFLLFNIFNDYLVSTGVDERHIIKISLEETENFLLHNPLKLSEYIKSLLIDKKTYYIFIDEIQLVQNIKNPDQALRETDEITFYSVINGLLKKNNVDIYVTGSNSRMLSSDIMTEFRGRGDEVRIYPFNFKEFMETYKGDVYDGWQEFLEYGGLPLCILSKGHEAKSLYLKNIFEGTYIKDVVERNNIRDTDTLEDIINIVASSVGSLTNPLKIQNTFKSSKHETVSVNTIKSYINDLENAFLIEGVNRYNVKGRKYISTPLKYYFADTGLRNARLNFRQFEETHLMENIIYTELKIRGYDVDVGVVEINEKNEKGSGIKKQLEIDFVANKAEKRIYIQSALSIDDSEKEIIEKRPFKNLDDSFKKLILVKGKQKTHTDEKGYITMGIIDFLLDENSLDR